MAKTKALKPARGSHAANHHTQVQVHVGSGNDKKAGGPKLSFQGIAVLFILAFGLLGSYLLFASHADSLSTLYKLRKAADGPNAVLLTTDQTVVYQKAGDPTKAGDKGTGWSVVDKFHYINEAGATKTKVYQGHQKGTDYNVFLTDLSKLPAGWENRGVVFYESTGPIPAGYVRCTESGFGLDVPVSTPHSKSCQTATSPPPGSGSSPTGQRPTEPKSHIPTPSFVTVSGNVTDKTTGAGIAGATISTCADPSTVNTDKNGNFSFKVPQGNGYCVKVSYKTPAGWVGPAALNNRPEHGDDSRYLGQQAGQDEYHNVNNSASHASFTWDRAKDSGFDFIYKSPASNGHSTGPIVVNHNPYGYIDYCSYTNNETVIYGWAADPDAAKELASPKASLNLSYTSDFGKSVEKLAGVSGRKAVLTTVLPTDGAKYRDAAINTYIKSRFRSDPTPGTYGFRAAFVGLYQGNHYQLGGMVLNEGAGNDSALGIAAKSNTDGDPSKPYFAGDLIPDSCLAPKTNKPVAPGVTTAPAAVPVSSPSKPLALYSNDHGTFSWKAGSEPRYQADHFSVINGDYSLSLTGNNLVETFKGKTIWQDPATMNYPDKPDAKHAQLKFSNQAQLQVIDPNAPGKDLAIWQTRVLYGASSSSVYSLQLSRCGGAYIYLQESGQLTGGRKILNDNSAKDPSCGPAQLASNDRLANGTSLYAGMSLVSKDGSHRLVMQPNGTVALRDKADKVVWQASGKGAYRLAMVHPGILALLNRQEKIVWSSGTQGSGGDYAVLQDNGFLAIWNSSPKQPVAVWENGVSAKSCTDKNLVASYPANGGITCTKPVISDKGGKFKAPPQPAPCTAVGNGKYSCKFVTPAPVENSHSQLVGTLQKEINVVTCQLEGTYTVNHDGDKGSWWAKTVADNGQTGWVSVVFAKGGENGGKFQDVPKCGSNTLPASLLVSLPTHQPRKGKDNGNQHGSGGGNSGNGSQGNGSPVKSLPKCDLTHDYGFGKCVDPADAKCGDHGQYGYKKGDQYPTGNHCGCQQGWSTDGDSKTCAVHAKDGSLQADTYACQHPGKFSHGVDVQGPHTHAFADSDGRGCKCDGNYAPQHGKSHDTCELKHKARPQPPACTFQYDKTSYDSYKWCSGGVAHVVACARYELVKAKVDGVTLYCAEAGTYGECVIVGGNKSRTPHYKTINQGARQVIDGYTYSCFVNGHNFPK